MPSSRILYGTAVFGAAFLLFLIEPIAAKQILPALGGSSAVWMTCLVFFQLMLLLGYLYAHWLTRRVAAGRQPAIHLSLLAAAVLISLVELRFHPSFAHASLHPVAAIFVLLSAGIGLPFLLLASTSPLLQVWLAERELTAVKYRLFALSNTGSLLALILYPTVIEPHLPLHVQIIAWSGAFCLCALVLGLIASRNRPSAEAVVPVAIPQQIAAKSTMRQRLLWLLLPLVSATQLSAVTGFLTQDIAAIPLLWILPLIVYLVSFILAFQAPALYRGWIVVRLLVVLLAALGYMLTKTDMSVAIIISIVFFLMELFFACYFLHAEVYALRPERASEATLFYLFIAAGGVAGAFFIGIASPMLFNANYDIGISFFMTAAAALVIVWPATREEPSAWPQRLLWSTAAALLLALIVMMHTAFTRDAKIELRNFYGSLRVRESAAPPQAFLSRTLQNGSIQHGMQWFAPEFRKTPLTYYAPDSGIGLALENCCEGRGKRVGIIGLGAGTIAAYGKAGDQFTFYEINPAVEPVARNLFTYMRESAATINVIEGDARISLAGEPPQQFDVIAVDAFSGDAIPLHLMTREALALFRSHLRPGGVIAYHVSNQYLNLTPEVALLASSAGLEARVVQSAPNAYSGEFAATWVLVSADEALLDSPVIANASRRIEPSPTLRVWTDDYSSLLPIFTWKPGWL